MFFDATARVAPEKQDMPACLPMVSFPGHERASMHYETETGITITLMHDEVHEQPFLVLRNVPGLPGNHTYTAAAFLDTAAAERGFVVGADWPDQLPFHIEAHEVLEIAQLVRSSTDRKRGYFEMKWVALQPSDPF